MMSETQRTQWVAALLRERLGYLNSNKPERAKQVEAELKRFGYVFPKEERVPTTPKVVSDPKHLPPQGRSRRPQEKS